LKLEPASKQMLAIELKKLAGADPKSSLRRWHRSLNMMTGAFVILSGEPGDLTPGHFDEWESRIKTIQKDITRLRKKLRK
jgi:hypothetical protein